VAEPAKNAPKRPQYGRKKRPASASAGKRPADDHRLCPVAPPASSFGLEDWAMYGSTAVLSLFVAVYGGFTAKAASAEVWPNAFGGYRSSAWLCSVLCHVNDSDKH
jgi:hypothetical protein